jgi:hypothetical protein
VALPLGGAHALEGRYPHLRKKNRLRTAKATRKQQRNFPDFQREPPRLAIMTIRSGARTGAAKSNVRCGSRSRKAPREYKESASLPTTDVTAAILLRRLWAIGLVWGNWCQGL